MLSLPLRRLVNCSLPLLLTLFCLIATPARSLAQDKTTTTENKNEEVNLDTQLYLIVGTNQEVTDAKIPASLDSVIKQLKASLPFRNYRLAATLLNRVKTDGRLSLKWIGGPLLESGAEPRQTPSFNEFNVRAVKLVDDAEGRKVVRMDGFNFGARIPIQTATGLVASNGGAPVQVINYENTGLNTDISMREGEPVLVGTLNVGPSGDAIILIVSARRTPK